MHKAGTLGGLAWAETERGRCGVTEMIREGGRWGKEERGERETDIHGPRILLLLFGSRVGAQGFIGSLLLGEFKMWQEKKTSSQMASYSDQPGSLKQRSLSEGGHLPLCLAGYRGQGDYSR